MTLVAMLCQVSHGLDRCQEEWEFWRLLISSGWDTAAGATWSTVESSKRLSWFAGHENEEGVKVVELRS